jgi:hypothetical protein
LIAAYPGPPKAPLLRGFFFALKSLKLLKITVCLSVFFKPETDVKPSR